MPYSTNFGFIVVTSPKMGCCASTTNSKSAAAASASASDEHRQHSAAAAVHGTPPRPPSHQPLLEEEESVKEVLPETATVPKSNLAMLPDNNIQHGIVRISGPNIKGEEFDNFVPYKNNPGIVNSEQLSEWSEICSTTVSDSVATTVTDKEANEDGEVHQQKLVNISPAKITDQCFSGEHKRDKVVGRSPARTLEPSPGGVRSLPGRDTRGGSADDWQRGNNTGGGSGRRSRSPTTRTNNNNGAVKMAGGLGKSQSTRVSGKSPGRIRSDLNQKNQKVETELDFQPPTNNESLENPLVSLECFIFL